MEDDKADQPGLIYVLNNLGDKWSGTSVKTQWQNQKFVPVAWSGHDEAWPDARTTDGEGNSEFPAPPRGYAVYAPVFEGDYPDAAMEIAVAGPSDIL